MLRSTENRNRIMPTLESPATAILRQPTIEDAANLWQLVGNSGTLDRNSAYLYLLLCRDFADTCLVAERAGRLIGFVSAYRLPNDPTVLFIWQVGVDASARRQGLASNMLRRLVRRFTQQKASGDSIRFVEATVSPSNHPSRQLFESLARGLDAPLEDTDGFAESLFPSGDHEAEPRIRIGPINSAQLATDAA